MRDTRSGQIILTANAVRSMAWSPDTTRIAVSAENRKIQVLNARSGQVIFTYYGHSVWTDAVAWSPDGQHIASGSHDHTVQVWNAIDGSGIFTYRGHTDVVRAVVWSPNGTCIRNQIMKESFVDRVVAGAGAGKAR